MSWADKVYLIVSLLWIIVAFSDLSGRKKAALFAAYFVISVWLDMVGK